MIYLELLLVAFITIYIVDLSGFTESWRGLIANLLGIKALKPLPPFDCGQCMTWWVCLIYAAICNEFSLGVVAFSALLSFLSIPIGQFLMFLKESLISLINKLTDLCLMHN